MPDGDSRRVVAHVLVDDLSYRTVGSGILGLPGLRSVTMPGADYTHGARATLLFEATVGSLDPLLIKSECERMGARDVEVEALDV